MQKNVTTSQIYLITISVNLMLSNEQNQCSREYFYYIINQRCSDTHRTNRVKKMGKPIFHRWDFVLNSPGYT